MIQKQFYGSDFSTTIGNALGMRKSIHTWHISYHFYCIFDLVCCQYTLHTACSLYHSPLLFYQHCLCLWIVKGKSVMALDLTLGDLLIGQWGANCIKKHTSAAPGINAPAHCCSATTPVCRGPGWPESVPHSPCSSGGIAHPASAACLPEGVAHRRDFRTACTSSLIPAPRLSQASSSSCRASNEFIDIITYKSQVTTRKCGTIITSVIWRS